MKSLENLGGVVRNVIPDFRIKREDIEKDVALCKAYGAEFVTGKEVASIKALKEKDIQMLSLPSVHGNLVTHIFSTAAHLMQ